MAIFCLLNSYYFRYRSVLLAEFTRQPDNAAFLILIVLALNFSLYGIFLNTNL